MATSKRALTSAATVAVGLAIVGGAAAANAASSGTTTATLPTATSTTAPSTTAIPGDFQGRGGHKHTPVTGDELTKVTEAVKAKDAGVTVAKVRKDPDGSYDVLAVKDGSPIRFEVSADLATITQGRDGGRGGMRGLMTGLMKSTVVSGDEATKVTNAVTGKDSGVTVEIVLKATNGSYRAVGTKDQKLVMFRVSADLATVTQAPAGGRGRGMHGAPGQGQTGDGQTQTPTPSAIPSTAPSTRA